MKIQRVSSKWAKTTVILQNRLLAAYIPDTRKYSQTSLRELLELYETVYIKPDRGTYGIGVMRVQRRMVSLEPSGQQNLVHAGQSEGCEASERIEPKLMYVLRYGLEAEAFNSLEELHAAIVPKLGRRTYLIQQGIDLLRHEERPFDLRVLTQKNPEGAWETTGMLGRLAAPQKIVTNYHNGGSIHQVKTLFKPHMSPLEIHNTLQELKALGIRIGAQLETAYPGIKEIGLDVALDQHHDLWLLEVNTLPAVMIFKTFPDKRIYRRIHRYAVAYGRFRKTRSSPSRSRKTYSRR
ncbi:YheC/YheD family protein ['Paenibacillus yunnanensis' Narsing Rao et al. 2020]|uniref:YheC/YheD family protein n=1 Tax=Paenibacillus tengchongensis TaxID=2608684 RepID=UPI00124CAF47|nr:YheC/YheD family protein [Paenibacillus tengchongensis]